MKDAFLRWLYYRLIVLVYRLVMPYTVIGRENIPDVSDGPFLLVGNHFSYFEVPLLGLVFPHDKLRFFASPDTLGEFRLIDSFYRVFGHHTIYVHRGTANRESLKAGLAALRGGDWLVIFPEGGVTAEAINLATSTGESVSHLQQGYFTRTSGQLIEPRPGTALMAIQSGAPIIPIAFWGTEKVEANLKRWRRTRLTIRIGKPLSPIVIPEGVRGRERRAFMDDASHKIMQGIADLMPAENRGPYA